MGPLESLCEPQECMFLSGKKSQEFSFPFTRIHMVMVLDNLPST